MNSAESRDFNKQGIQVMCMILQTDAYGEYQQKAYGIQVLLLDVNRFKNLSLIQSNIDGVGDGLKSSNRNKSNIFTPYTHNQIYFNWLYFKKGAAP